MLNLHLTHFPDERRTALGITGPHLVTDATGFGLVLSALGSELRGEKWTPPPLSSQSGTCDLHPINFPAREDGGASSQTPGNLRAALSKILAEPEPKRVETPPGLAAMSAMDMLSMVTKIGMDFARNGGSRRWIWLPDAALEKIVKPIKQQAKEEDASVNVSTVDCLAAWLLKVRG